MKQQIFKIAYITFGLLCICLLVYTQFPNVFSKKRVNTEMAFNDMDCREMDNLLYKDNLVEDFLPKYVKLKKKDYRDVIVDKPEKHTVNEARVLFFGDSFMRRYIGNDFERYTGVPTFSHTMHGIEDPLKFFKKVGLKREEKPRYLVLESIERFMIMRFRKYPMEQPPKENAVQAWLKKNVFINTWFLERIISTTGFVEQMVACRNTFRYRAFGYVSSLTPVYSTDPPMLFIDQSVDFNRREDCLSKASDIADTIAAISKEMKDRYNITTIFMPTPNKLSIYGKYAGEQYNGFLPELYGQLAKRGVIYIDLYDDMLAHSGEFESEDELLYHPAGTHWTFKGSAIGIDKLINTYNRLEAENR